MKQRTSFISVLCIVITVPLHAMQDETAAHYANISRFDQSVAYMLAASRPIDGDQICCELGRAVGEYVNDPILSQQRAELSLPRWVVDDRMRATVLKWYMLSRLELKG